MHATANWNANFTLMFSDTDDIVLMLLLVVTGSEGLQLSKVFFLQAVEKQSHFCSHYIVLLKKDILISGVYLVK